MTDRIELGTRIRELRGKLLTQQELADRAQVSVDLIRKLEQGRRHTASITSLQQIARALDVDVADLLSKATPLPSDDPESGVVALRRVLTSVDDLLGEGCDDCGSGAGVNVVDREVTYSWGSYWRGDYDALGALLPQTVLRARAAVREASTGERPRAVDLLAQVYQVAGCMLVHLGHPDAAWTAFRSALSTAELGDDRFRGMALRGSLSWYLLTQGRYDEASVLAVRSASEIEPSGKVPEKQLSVWGSLLLTGATAAGRARQDARAMELLGAAREAADRLGVDRNDYETAFGPAQVVMQTVDVNVVTERFGDALTTARRMPRDAALPLAARARHLADVAYAQTRLGRHEKAVDTLYSIADAAPDWIRNQALPRQTLAELCAHEPPSRVRELAKRIGVVAN